jgi:phosphatidylglycerophosphate synthase
MIEPYIRPFYQRIFGNNLACVVGKVLSPNAVTLLGVLVGVSIIPVLMYGHLYLALLFLAFSGILDTLDGTLARLYQNSSVYGAALDIVGDRIVEFSIILGLFLHSPETRAAECLTMLGSILVCVTSFLVVGIFTENDSHKSFHYSPGLMERLEAFIFFAALILFVDFFSLLAYLFSFLVLLTAILRLAEFKRQL